MSAMQQPAKPIDFRPQSALVIVAHPDDMDFYCAGLLAQWIAQGTKVNLVVFTAGEKGSQKLLTPAEITALITTRKQEQLASCELLGIEETVFLDYLDGELAFLNKKELQAQIVRAIRRFRPEVLISHDPNNRHRRVHIDHQTVGQLVLQSAFPISQVINCFPEQIQQEQLTPWQASKLLLFDTDLANYYINIASVLELKQNLLLKHQSQAYIFPDGPAAAITYRNGQIGAKYNLNFAEEYLVIDLLEQH